MDSLKNEIENWSGLENLDLAKVVSTEENYDWKETTWFNKNTNKKKEYNVT